MGLVLQRFFCTTKTKNVCWQKQKVSTLSRASDFNVMKISVSVLKNSGKSQSLESNQNKEIKIADSVLLSLFMRGNEKCNISHAPQHRLEWYSIHNNKCIGDIDAEGPEKYTCTILKLLKGRFCGVTFRFCYQTDRTVSKKEVIKLQCFQKTGCQFMLG